ncbi:MAG: DEAD/DEAH box helicase [Bacteroidaceae bacterium]|nr:DEAD/DEAH box helicase [Bacteroidaceae bacterium]
MSIIKQYLMTMKPAFQKLACLYAYIGQDLKEDDKLQLSVHGTCMMGELPILTTELIKENFVVHEPATHFGPQKQYIRPRFYGEVMLFCMEEHPEWLKEFDQWPLNRYTNFDLLQKTVRTLFKGKVPPPMVLTADMPPYLLGLVHDRRFERLITMIRDVDFPAFIGALTRKWIKDDFPDPEEMIPRQLEIRRPDNTDPDVRLMNSQINYFNYVCRGIYTPPTSIRMNQTDLLMKGVHAMSQGKSDLALKVFGEALNAQAGRSGKDAEPYLTDGVAAFYWVIATWTGKQSNIRERLRAFVKAAKESNMYRIGAAVLLADTLSNPIQRMDMDLLTQIINPMDLAAREYVLQQRMAMLLAANFTGMQLTEENFKPASAFLRHEAIKYITLNRFEKKTLTNAFGSKPVASFAKAKDPWELMLDRLIASETQKLNTGGDEEEHRVMYIITNDGESVELREQNRLKDGRWGSGKTLPWNRFISGTEPFMDRTDQAVVADVRFHQANRLTVGIILPHLVGSDRVFTGEQQPFRRVNIEQQKPYVIIERNEAGFSVQSNVFFQDLLSQTNVYRREDSMHYIIFPMSDHERTILQELLSVNSLPPEAEEKLLRLLPMLAKTTEIHSDLIPKDTELQSLEPQSSILLRLTPDPSTQTMFDGYFLVRPLLGGQMAVTPAQGDRVIIDQTEISGRVRIERDFEAEGRNLHAMLTFCQEHDIEVSETLNTHLATPQVLDLLGFISGHSEISAVEWPEGEKLRMRKAQQGEWNLSLTPRGRWFEIEGNVKLDDNSILTAQQLMQALTSSHGGYIQLQNGDYLWLSEKLRRQLDALESITTTENNRPMVSTLQTTLLADIINGDINIHCDSDFQELKERIERADKIDPQVPDTLQATLRTYQVEGYKWLCRLSAWGAGACLADDMGLGKTVQTIAFLLSQAQNGAALVVAPASVVPNWRSEINRFAPSLNVYIISECFDRDKVVCEAGAGDVLIATYGLMVPMQSQLGNKDWNVVCLDEAHNIKNRGTKTSAACMKLQAINRLILTGTPVQNHLGELWNLFQFINPGLLGTYEQFNQKYILPIESLQDTERQQQLQVLVSPFMLRRTKQAVVKELPEKTEINIDVELTPDEMAFYEVMRRQAEEKFKEEGDQLTVNALAELTRLRRTACSAELTDPTWTGGSSKVNAFMELVQSIVDGGHSVIVFSQFTSFLGIIQRALKEADLPFLYLDGTVPIKQREQRVANFQRGATPVFLISLKAGGVGLNLTAANYVIHLDPWWNPAIEQQATDRAYRIGQTQAVTVYHLVSHHTIEEKILRLHESKRALSDSILEGADQNYKLTSKEMLEMLSNQW